MFWVQMIFAGVMAVLKCTLPETYAPVILKRRARKLRKETGDPNIATEQELFKVPFSQLLVETLIRPFQMLLTEPILLLLSLYIALIYGLLYCWFESFVIVYVQIYGKDATLLSMARNC